MNVVIIIIISIFWDGERYYGNSPWLEYTRSEYNFEENIKHSKVVCKNTCRIGVSHNANSSLAL